MQEATLDHTYLRQSVVNPERIFARQLAGVFDSLENEINVRYGNLSEKQRNAKMRYLFKTKVVRKIYWFILTNPDSFDNNPVVSLLRRFTHMYQIQMNFTTIRNEEIKRRQSLIMNSTVGRTWYFAIEDIEKINRIDQLPEPEPRHYGFKY